MDKDTGCRLEKLNPSANGQKNLSHGRNVTDQTSHKLAELRAWSGGLKARMDGLVRGDGGVFDAAGVDPDWALIRPGER